MEKQFENIYFLLLSSLAINSSQVTEKPKGDMRKLSNAVINTTEKE